MAKKSTLIFSIIAIICFNFQYVFVTLIISTELSIHFDSFNKYIIDSVVVHAFLLSVFFVVVAITKTKVKARFFLDKKSFGLLFLGILIGFVIVHIGIYLFEPVSRQLFDFGYSNEMKNVTEGTNNPFRFFLFLLIVGFFAPITEELYMRLYVYENLREYFGIIISVGINSFIFLLLHPVPSTMLFILFSNICLCLSYEYTKRGLTPIIIHITINVVNMLYATGIFPYQ